MGKFATVEVWTGKSYVVRVYRIKKHLCVAVTKGSHAPYPAPGNYAVYFANNPALVEPAEAGKVLIPQGYSFGSDIENAFNEVNSYNLKNLELGSITSNLWNNILAYSDYIVDILGPQNAKFPPYTERELNIDK